MKETTISKTEEFVQAVCQLNNDITKAPQLWSQELLFRGQSNKAYELLPGIARGRHSFIPQPLYDAVRSGSV